LEYFDYEVSGSLETFEYIDANVLFVGNQQIEITDKIDYLYQVISDSMAHSVLDQ
jgi:CDP-6-deoxy-D-xylo-4-hexulose-3-dehydrase